jgi:hypothetical protein
VAVDGSISGMVTGPTGAVIENAPVSITNIKTQMKIEIKTGPTGNFGPTSVYGGEHTVRIHMGCLKRYSKVVNINEDQSLETSIALHPSRGCADLNAEKP